MPRTNEPTGQHAEGCLCKGCDAMRYTAPVTGESRWLRPLTFPPDHATRHAPRLITFR